MVDRVTEAEGRIADLEDTVQDLKPKVADLSSKTLEDHSADAKGRSRRNNFRFLGFPEEVDGRSPDQWSAS